MTIDARIVRVRQRPNGVLLYLDAYPGKLGIIRATHTPAVGMLVQGEDVVLVGPGEVGVGGMWASYRREGLRLYEGSGA